MGLKQGLNQSIGGINRGLNQFLSPFVHLSLPTHQDRPLQAMRKWADAALRHAGVPALKDLAKIPFSDPRRKQADAILHTHLSQNHLYGARAKLPSGQNRRLDHWTDLLSKPELQQFINGMEKALLPKAVALSGMNDPKGPTVPVPKDEAFKHIGAIKQEVQDYFRGVWPAEAKPLLGTLDALQSYTIDQRVDALRTRLSQSGRPIDKIISMGIGWIRTINPLAVINSLHTLDQEIARTGSTKPFEQALQAIGLQFKDLASVGKDLVVLLPSGT